ncbi:hypothetical protein O0L34_g19309 [Tuta absoluta]|nr:hypothetical protein O0L34_g19309 [Tuta absoluta]
MRLKNVIVPESEDNSDDDNHISVISVQTQAFVNNSKDKERKNKRPTRTIKRKNLRKENEEAMDEIEVFEENPTENQDEDYSCDTDSDYNPDKENSNKKRPKKHHVLDSEEESNKEGSIAASLQNELHDLANNEASATHNESQIENQNGRPKKGRKRNYPDHTLAQRKNLKYNNLPYNGHTKRVEPKVFHDFACKCNNQCFALVSQEQKKEEFDKYISCGSYEAQLLYILNNVKESEKERANTVTKNKSGKKKPRTYKRFYSICDIKVCKEMFLNNFQISSKKVDFALKKKRSGCLKDCRGIAQGGWNKKPDEDCDFVKQVINALPTYASHYRREQSDCKYLQLGMTVEKIYEIYKDELTDVYGTAKEPVSFEVVKRIFYYNFNLRCKTLKKDTCNRCDASTHKIKNCTSDEMRLKLEEEKQNHLKAAENLRKEMNEDLSRAKWDEKFE